MFKEILIKLKEIFKILHHCTPAGVPNPGGNAIAWTPPDRSNGSSQADPGDPWR